VVSVQQDGAARESENRLGVQVYAQPDAASRSVPGLGAGRAGWPGRPFRMPGYDCQQALGAVAMSGSPVTVTVATTPSRLTWS